MDILEKFLPGNEKTQIFAYVFVLLILFFCSVNWTAGGLGDREIGFQTRKIYSANSDTVNLNDSFEDDNSLENTITIEKLLGEMTDLERLAHTPDHGLFTAQASSYDRASRIENGEKENWFANEDSGNFITTIQRNNRKEHVMADLEGPGAIVRIWSANPRGTLRIYIDNSTNPVISSDFKKLISGSEDFPFVEPFADMRGWGGNLYFPITFAENALVTCENPKDLYYHIGYRLFPQGTKVESYSEKAVEKAKTKANKIAEDLLQPYSSWEFPENSNKKEIDWNIQPGKIKTISFEGPAKIESIELNLEAGDLESALRNTVLKIRWDNYRKPSVWAPLGDFFGTGPGYNPYNSLPLGMLENGEMYSHWVMPFENEARMTVLNDGEENIELTGKIITQAIQWDNSLMYFHAKWKTQYPIPTRPIKEWKILETSGPGRFVGVSLSVTNPSWLWWGEGDEKFYVDGEEFPSTFGTGTEDYFGYAWGNPSYFSSAYHNQPRADGPLNYGHISNSRFHVFDGVPFQEEFNFDLEIWHIRDRKVGYSGIAYWYTDAVNQDSFQTPVPKENREIVNLPPMLKVSSWVIWLVVGLFFLFIVGLVFWLYTLLKTDIWEN